MQLGLIGLGKMGGNMRERMRRAGLTVVGFDRNPDVSDVDSLEALVEALPSPKVVWVMVPAGDPTRAKQLTTFGDRLFRSGNFHRAAERYEQALRADNHSAAPHVGLAQIEIARGRYDEAAGTWVCARDGSARCYRSTDNLVDPARVGWPPERVIDLLGQAGLLFAPTPGTGVVLHMLECLAVDGRVGLTAIGRTVSEAQQLYDDAASALTDSAAAS